MEDAVLHKQLSYIHKAGMKQKKRPVELVVLSDIHLGTYGCHAKELARYLASIRPQLLVLNGDIIDIWQFSPKYWPKSHMRVVKRILGMVSKGVQVVYITGNHDEMLRKFVGFRMGSLRIENKIVHEFADGKKAWIFHGDVFDVTMQHSRWLAKLGATGYDILILINRGVNALLEKVRLEKISLSKRIKDSVKSAVKFINDFEETAAVIGIENKYDYVVCGHIHQPGIREIVTDRGAISYLNSGDWVENLTALEYHEGRWSLYKFHEDELLRNTVEEEDEGVEPDNRELFDNLVEEFRLPKG